MPGSLIFIPAPGPPSILGSVCIIQSNSKLWCSINISISSRSYLTAERLNRGSVSGERSSVGAKTMAKFSAFIIFFCCCSVTLQQSSSWILKSYNIFLYSNIALLNWLHESHTMLNWHHKRVMQRLNRLHKRVMQCWIDSTKESRNVELTPQKSHAMLNWLHERVMQCWIDLITKDAESSLFLWSYARWRHWRCGYTQLETAAINHLHAPVTDSMFHWVVEVYHHYGITDFWSGNTFLTNFDLKIWNRQKNNNRLDMSQLSSLLIIVILIVFHGLRCWT